MKKIWPVMIGIIFLFLPTLVQAKNYGIEHYYIHASVQENGDLYVQELFDMNGEYNGFDRLVNFKNASAPIFDGSLNSFEGSSIYNGDNVILSEIRSIPHSVKIDFNTLQSSGTLFQKTMNGVEGSSGVYEETKTTNGVNYKIYLPSQESSYFYLSYTIKNIGIVHNDIAEIGWNLFSDQLTESVHYLAVTIDIPNNQTLLRAFAHGPLHGDINLNGINQIHATIEDVHAKEPLDIRFAFDSAVLNRSNKKSGVEALSSIIQVETKRADEANLLREQEKEQQLIQKNIGIGVNILTGISLLGVILYTIYANRVHDKEYKSIFQAPYFREFPSENEPGVVGYLIRKNVNHDDLSASILNLIVKKIITFEGTNEKTYLLKKNDFKTEINQTDQNLLDFLFEQKEEIQLKELKNRAKKGYESFIQKFTVWKRSVQTIAENQSFYENKNSTKGIGIVICVLTAMFSFFTMVFGSPFLHVITILISFIALFYLSTFSRRTIKANEEYQKWMALKRFMTNFGRMGEKELPAVALWEKYLVYALTLGCADVLSKQMELKVHELYPNEEDYNGSGSLFNFYTLNQMMIFNHVLNQSIHSAVQNAYSAQSVANSNSSSGGGFGGGFSGGGGSFGGGGGGGRF